MVMTCTTSGQIGEQVECQHAIVLRVLDLFMIRLLTCRLAIELPVGECPRLRTFGDVLNKSTVSQTEP